MSGLLRRAVACASAALLVTPAGTAANAADPPLVLPGDARAASVWAERATWIVGARPGPAAHAVARRNGARRAGPAGTGGYVVPRARARALAAALRERGLLVYAQPNTLAEPLTAGGDRR